MNRYELTVLFHPDLEIDLDKALKKVEQIIASADGKITSTDNWGKRHLAYPIKKEEFAIYVFYELELPPEAVKKINDTLNITGEVLRFLLVAHDVRADKAAAAKAEKEKEAAEKSAATATAKNEEAEEVKE